MDLDDVETIWWFAASRMSKRELRARLNSIIQRYPRPFDCFSYVPISDSQGRGRYPRGVTLLLKQLLKPRNAMLASDGALYIQVLIWHAVTEKAFQWMPAKALPRHLKIMKLEDELGL